MARVSVRYIVHDVDAAIDFYCRELGFHEDMHPAPSFAMLSLGDLRLVLSAPGRGPGGGQAMPDGTMPEPWGWNRFQLEADDIETTVAGLRERGAHFRSEVINGVAGKQILLSRIQPAIRSSSSSRSFAMQHWATLRNPDGFRRAAPDAPSHLQSACEDIW
jgi:catechol 2,3-dioxygenase-like lactoylglutathione lyase family enzyme